MNSIFRNKAAQNSQIKNLLSITSFFLAIGVFSFRTGSALHRKQNAQDQKGRGKTADI
jgi:hypothetical protein